MNKTHTPLIIEGKIYVVEQEPRVTDYGTEDITHGRFYKDCQEFHSRQPQQLPTLPEHAPYWKERIGQQLSESDFRYAHGLSGMNHITYAIPPQQKQEDTKPLVTEAFACNGAHSHWRLIDPENGDLLWSEEPEEDAKWLKQSQQKQNDVDLWDEAEIKLTGKYPLKDTGFVMDILKYLKQHYSLTKK